jgi:hypothetical protein
VISKEEFAKVVKAMQAEGKPLTVRNLMIQTELPRATVEQWLEELQENADLVPKAEPKKKPEQAPTKGAKVKEKVLGQEEESIFSRASALKDQVVGDVVKSQLGLDAKEKTAGDQKKSIATGAILGLIFPPAAFAYAAPLLEGILASVIYLAVAIGIQKIPIIGGLLGIYVVLALNLLGAFMGLAYAFRYNRNGKRMPLLPKGKDDDE